MTGGRVVYDCMLYLQAVLRPHRTHGTFRAAQSGQVTLCVSADLLAEVRDVLTRPALVAKAPGLTPEVVDAFLRDVLGFATLIRPVPEVYTLDRDPKDSKYINLALAAGADRIVTWDADLLALMEERRPEALDFRQRFPALRIVQPPEFLHELGRRGGG